MFDPALANERLKVRSKLHSVRRIEVDHLDLFAEKLIAQKRIHHDERVAQNHSIDPFVCVLVSAEDLISDRMLRIAEELEHILLAIARVAFQRFENRLSREPLMNEQRQ